MRYEYRTENTCSQLISFDIEGNVITNIEFYSGCNGNLKAVSKVVRCQIAFVCGSTGLSALYCHFFVSMDFVHICYLFKTINVVGSSREFQFVFKTFLSIKIFVGIQTALINLSILAIPAT